MKKSLRIKIGNLTLFGLISYTQTVVGITSLVENVGDVWENKHILFWDLEGCSFDEVIKELDYIQEIYELGEIYIIGDNEKGETFNAICFSRVAFRRFLEILIATQYVDYLFYRYTITRGKATIRLTDKIGRGKHRILKVLEGPKYAIPTTMERVIYDTGLDKIGSFFEVGDIKDG